MEDKRAENIADLFCCFIVLLLVIIAFIPMIDIQLRGALFILALIIPTSSLALYAYYDRKYGWGVGPQKFDRLRAILLQDSISVEG